jgi:hypothetical protein
MTGPRRPLLRGQAATYTVVITLRLERITRRDRQRSMTSGLYFGRRLATTGAVIVLSAIADDGPQWADDGGTRGKHGVEPPDGPSASP